MSRAAVKARVGIDGPSSRAAHYVLSQPTHPGVETAGMHPMTEQNDTEANAPAKEERFVF